MVTISSPMEEREEEEGCEAISTQDSDIIPLAGYIYTVHIC